MPVKPVKVVINDSAGLTWYVDDSKMWELIEFLHKIAVHQQPTKPTEPPSSKKSIDPD